MNEQSNDKTLEGLCKSVKHTKWPSAFAYDEMNIQVKGWVINKSKCVKDSDWGYNMIRAQCEIWEQSQMILNKCYQNVLTYETIKLIKRRVFMNTLIKVLKLIYT